MAQKTNIEWCDAVWNFVRGCSRVSDGCRNCYAEGVAARFSGKGQPYEGLAKFVDHKPRWTGEIGFFEDVLTQPLRWKRPRKIFVNSMSDLFHEKVEDEWLDKAFAVMALTPQHTYQILTKRQERMRDYMNDPETRMRVALEMNHFIWCHPDTKKVLSKQYPKGFLHEELFGYTDTGDQDEDLGNPYLKPWPLPNVWLGVSVEDQKTADERIPLLLDTPAAVRWVSAEPLLGPVRLDQFPVCDGVWANFLTGRDYIDDGREVVNNGIPVQHNKIDWVIVGGESGPNARPMHPDWVRSIRDQCQDAGVPFFFKQVGEWASPADPAFGQVQGEIRAIRSDGSFWPEPPADENADALTVVRVGKKKAGRLLDGREWNEMPNG